MQGFPGGVSAMLVAGRLDIEALILVLLTVLRARLQTMGINSKSRFVH
jgi:hypothetical protein